MKMLVTNCRFFLLILTVLLTPLVLVGCGESEENQPETATVKVEILSSPNPLTVVESVVENNPNGPICKAGDILQSGENCFYPGTDIEMSVLDDGTLKILNMFLNTRQIHFENTSINGTPITLIAQRHNDNSWKIEKIGDAGNVGKLELLVSDDFIWDPDGSPTHNTEDIFSITEDFEQTFPLDSNAPRLSVKLINKTPYTLSIRLTILLDDESEHDESENEFTPGSAMSYSFKQE